MGGIVILIFILAIISAFLVFKEPLKALVNQNQAITPAAVATPPRHATQTKERSSSGSPEKSTKPDDHGVIVVEGGAGTPSPQLVASSKPSTSSLSNNGLRETSAPENPDPPKKATLYWIKVSDDGQIHLQKAVRQIRMGDSPMSSAIRALLRGPNADELNASIQTLVPTGTQLLSAYVQNRVAFLNFSEEFQFNTLGTEGLKAQLRQIVFTATEFETVESVQILINGKHVQYLGGDGFFVGKPIGRNAF